MQMGGGFVVEPQRPRERVDHLGRGVVIAALFQAQVVVRADAGEHRQLLAPQARNAPTSDGMKVDLLGAHQLTTGAQVLTECRARHAPTIRAPAQPVPRST